MNLIKPVHAIICNPVLEDCATAADNPLSINKDPTRYTNSIVQTIISVLFIFGIVYFIFHFILAGYKMIASQGDPKKYEEAQHALTNSLIGIVVIFSIFVILRTVGYMFGITGLGDDLTVSWPTL